MYKVHAKKMYDDGYKFYLSVNGVWLTKDVPVQYLEKWEDDLKREVNIDETSRAGCII